MGKIMTVLRFELKKYFSDRKRAVTGLLSSALIVVAIMIVSMLLGNSQKEQDYYLFIEGNNSYDRSIPTSDGKKLYIIGISEEEAYRKQADYKALADGCLVLKDGRIVFDSSEEKSVLISTMCEGLLNRLKYLTVDPNASEIFGKVSVIDLNNGQNLSNRILALILPLLLLPFLFGKITGVITESIAREKENGVFCRNILTGTPIAPFIMGKMIAGILFGIVTLAIYIISILLCDFFSSKWGYTITYISGTEVTFVHALGIIFFSLLLCVLFSAVSVYSALLASSYENANNYAVILEFAILLLGLTASIKDGTLTILEHYIPIYNICLVFREILTDSVTPLKLIITFITQAAFTLLAVGMTVKVFEKEENIFL